ncbi:pilus assembly protein TadG-related protein [Phytohabitans flavus]|uniref:pilus assembly protein TadG-related protein n=1 Tax=Phytohabitans flavus TaxID=1076124 RepID=UPI00362F0110
MKALRRDDGRVSIFLAIALAGMLMVIGLAYDGAGQLGALQRAHNLAAEAARAGGQSIDRAQAIEGGPTQIGEAEAVAAVDAYRAAAGVGGPPPTFSTGPGGEPLIQVEVSVTYDNKFLDVFGFSDTSTVTGTATAVLLTTPDE